MMPTETVREYDAAGRLIAERTVQMPEPPLDPIASLQAQVDALTDLMLGGAA